MEVLEGNKIKIFGIEKTGPDYYGTYQYRYFSLYNGARGGWCYDKAKAIEQGEAHEKIVLSLIKPTTHHQ